MIRCRFCSSPGRSAVCATCSGQRRAIFLANRPARRVLAPPAERGYDPAYRRDRAALLADGPVCVWCGAPATSADHVPTLAQLRAMGLGPHDGQLVPACADCQAHNVAARAGA
jgi:hypothetical protein